MTYKEIKPASVLQPYIDTYWMASGNGISSTVHKILPDGCIDIIVNFGDDCVSGNGAIILKTDAAYLVGTMTRHNTSYMLPETNLTGIRFKPGGFASFYRFDASENVDHTVDLERKFLPDTDRLRREGTDYLNRYFTDKLKPTEFNISGVVQHIYKHKGDVRIEELASVYCVSVRHLERLFKRFLGISPKQFINLVRFQNVYRAVRTKSDDTSLLDIAVDFGYYDHAHLTNHIKRYAGVSPSHL